MLSLSHFFETPSGLEQSLTMLVYTDPLDQNHVSRVRVLYLESRYKSQILWMLSKKIMDQRSLDRELYEAAEAMDLKEARILLDRGANPTALAVARDKGFKDVVEILESVGATEWRPAPKDSDSFPY
ncbi:hypothetical protein ASPZODRAFT_2114120 [Penicilliopsis zonata CBS 506.65]|uniref:Uncharacterized protein n=1 Tax=Penicilliopsis zonata CBS 506.65 TaxID=1073090 RepID=A0A1L9S8W7_9EURO|nr:hypothetical protein ASPZODRAFT_2114120 [Penicilliopsis zonata CBS 506.65]OJJ43569.1 hypothetical protein ASPZODRAFT_2114120 [Penicilliopsis zonata CBS 506.65]